MHHKVHLAITVFAAAKTTLMKPSVSPATLGRTVGPEGP